MTWELAVALRILGGSLLGPIVFKLLGQVDPRERFYRIFLQYAWTVAFVACVALFWGFIPSLELWPIFAIGALMPIGVFFQWKAMAMSPSRTGIFSEASSIVPLFLSAVFLGEWTVFTGNAGLVAGFVLVLVGVALHAYSDITNKRRGETATAMPLAFYGNALGFAFVFAFATFLENYWAKAGIRTPEFLVAWYLGAFLGSIVLLAVTRHLPRSTQRAMPIKREQILIFLGAVSIILSLGLQFTAFTLVQQTVALPIIAVGGIIGPALVGMLVFKEWKSIKGWAWLYFGISFVGALIMAFAH